MTKAKRTPRVLNSLETLGNSIVKAIKAGDIKFGKVAKVGGKDAVATGSKYTSVKNDKGTTVTVSKLTKKGSEQARATLTLSYPGTIKGAIRTTEITGEFARKAFDAVTFVPKTKKVVSAEEITEANEAFGF